MHRFVSLCTKKLSSNVGTPITSGAQPTNGKGEKSGAKPDTTTSAKGKTEKSGNICGKPPSSAKKRDIPSKDFKSAGKIAASVTKPKSVPQPALSAETPRFKAGETKSAPGKKINQSSKADKNADTSVTTPSARLPPRKSTDSASRQKSNPCFSLSLNSKFPLGGARSARDRVSDNNRMKVFEGQLLQLEAMQTAFMQKLEALKVSIPEMANREYKFVGVVLNEDCQILVHGDYLKKIPNNLPAHAIADFKGQIQDAFKGSLKHFQMQLKNKVGEEYAHLVENFEQEQAHCLSLLSDKIKNIFSTNDTSEQCVVKYQTEMLNSKPFATHQERHMSKLRKAHASQVKEFKLELAKKNANISELTRKIEILEKGQELPQKPVSKTTNEQKMEKQERARPAQAINAMKQKQTKLTMNLQKAKIAPKSALRELKEKNEEIAKLRKQVETSKKLFEDMRFRPKDSMLHEVKKLKATNEQTMKDYAALQEKLVATTKELKEIKDARVEVETYQAEIRKLKKDLLEKNKSEHRHFMKQLVTQESEVEIPSAEHLIKLLQESQDRSENLRLKQLELIARNELKIGTLKQTREACYTALPNGTWIRNAVEKDVNIRN